MKKRIALLSCFTGLLISAGYVLGAWVENGLAWIILVFQISLLSLPFLRREVDPFEPVCIFSLFFLLDLFRPLYLLLTGEESPIFVKGGIIGGEGSLMQKALLYWAIAILFYFIGYYGLKSVSQRLAMRMPRFEDSWPKDAFMGIFFSLLVFGFLSYLLLIQSCGGIAYLLSHLYLRRAIFKGKAYLLWSLAFAELATYTLFAYLLPERKGRWGIPLLLIITAMFLPLGGRGNIILLWLTILTLVHYLRSRLKLWQFLTLGLVMVTFAQVYLALRLATAEGGFNLFVLSALWREPRRMWELFTLDNVRFDYFALLLWGMPRELDFQMGRTYLYLLLNPVPRPLWPEKPPAIEGGIFRRAFFPDEGGGRTIGFPGVLYMNFHLPGIILGMLVLGLVHRILYQYLQGRNSGRSTVLLYALTLFRLRDLSNLAIINWLLHIIPALGVIALLNRAGRKRG